MMHTCVLELYDKIEKIVLRILPYLANHHQSKRDSGINMTARDMSYSLNRWSYSQAESQTYGHDVARDNRSTAKEIQ